MNQAKKKRDIKILARIMKEYGIKDMVLMIHTACQNLNLDKETRYMWQIALYVEADKN